MGTLSDHQTDLDTPLPKLNSLSGENDYDYFIKRYSNRNYILGVISNSFYILAMTFVMSSTILALYASQLVAQKTIIGVFFAIQSAALTLPQIFLANRVSGLSKYKPYILKFALFERIPYLLIAIIIIFLTGIPNTSMFLVLVVILGSSSFFLSFASLGFYSLIAKVIDKNKRAGFFGMGTGFGGLLSIAGTFAIRYILGHIANPISYGICFLLTFVFVMTAWVLLSFMKEPEKPVEADPNRSSNYFGLITGELKANRGFCSYITSQILIILAGMGASFYIIYGQSKFNTGTDFIANITLTIAIAQACGSITFGLLADYWGNKKIIEICTLFNFVSVGLLLFASDYNLLYIFFLILTLGNAGIVNSQVAISLEFSSPDKTPLYIAISNISLGIPKFICPILGGFVIDSLGYKSLFIGALLLYSFGWIIMHFTLRDPRKLT